MKELNISEEDVMLLNERGYMTLTNTALTALKAVPGLVQSVSLNIDNTTSDIYPQNGAMGWTRDNYGPIWIPKRGATLKLSLDNIAIYERPLRTYEGNDLQVTPDGKILINGKETTQYTFQMDYYWMQGDNRHNSADSRYWGFVPEDHVVGKPVLVWFSTDKDHPLTSLKHIRWNRLFRLVSNIK